MHGSSVAERWLLSSLFQQNLRQFEIPYTMTMAVALEGGEQLVHLGLLGGRACENGVLDTACTAITPLF
jgi:hypothetical protein